VISYQLKTPDIGEENPGIKTNSSLKKVINDPLFLLFNSLYINLMKQSHKIEMKQ
jgi:hypothetical protein